MRVFNIIRFIILPIYSSAVALELPDININGDDVSGIVFTPSPVVLVTEGSINSDVINDIGSSLDAANSAEHAGNVIYGHLEKLASDELLPPLIAESIDLTADSPKFIAAPGGFVDLLAPEGQLMEEVFNDGFTSLPETLAGSVNGYSAMPCRAYLGEELNVSFDDVAGERITRELLLQVQCDEGINYRLSATNGIEEKTRFIAALDGDNGRQPAIIDVRHPSGHTLSTHRYVGSGELQSLPVQLTLFSASKRAMTGEVRAVEDIRIELDVVR